MVSINTNLSSLITQKSLNSSTNRLNLAIERMSTGYKLNHSSDNAANYSISTDMNTQINAYTVAQDNIAMGMDMLSVAQDTISVLQDRGSRLQALITQARNGTYGADSLSAIQSEVQALVSEIDRICANTEYNGMKLFDFELPDWAKEVKNNAGVNNAEGFIKGVSKHTPSVIVSDKDDLLDALKNNRSVGITNSDVLAELAKIVNGGYDCRDNRIYLMNDIDLSDYQQGKGWCPIGMDSEFAGEFYGNGHVISNLKINQPDTDSVGLFGRLAGTIKDLGLENVDIKGQNAVGGLAGKNGGTVENCYTTGNVSGNETVGGLAGLNDCGTVENCYTTGNVSGVAEVGGLAGKNNFGMVENCYTTGNVSGEIEVGGLAGLNSGAVENCYTTGDVSGDAKVGGLAGVNKGTVENCYTTGNVSGDHDVGGLAGINLGTVENCYTTGNVSGDTSVGGLAGGNGGTVENCYTTGKVSGEAAVGGLAGGIEGGRLLHVASVTAQEEDGDIKDYTQLSDNSRTIQAGIYGSDDSRISFDTNLDIDINIGNLTSDGALDSVKTLMNNLNAKAVELGAAQNRLESALESTVVNIENLTSSRSTLRDADIAKESSVYIRQQILQQAAATLLSTANQSPSIALQLI